MSKTKESLTFNDNTKEKFGRQTDMGLHHFLQPILRTFVYEEKEHLSHCQS